VTVERQGPPLVTGATGFAGSHLVERLLQSHDTLYAWSHSGGASTGASDPRIRWSAVDLCDPASVDLALKDTTPSTVYHLAGVPHVAESWSQPGRALRVNAYGTHVLLDALARAGIDCPVVIAGSALVYRPSDAALTENDVVAPREPYGVSKLAQEVAAAESSARAVLARPFNHAGPRQPSSFVTSSFARQIAEIEAGSAEPVLHVGNLEARRDLTDVRDTVRAYEALAHRGQPRRTYNICSGNAHRVGDLLEMLLGMAKVRVRVEQAPSRLRPSDNPLVLGDPSRITEETGWRPEIPLEQTMRDLLDWWRSR
jgi:GDP-4-dehydro-6-deoxy-D-mannose reductase